MKKLLTTALLAVLMLTVITSAGAVSMLQQGDRGPTVRQLQQALVNGGWADIACDGVYGPKTAAAVKYYQQMHGLQATGRAGSVTLTNLLGSADVTLNPAGSNSMTVGSSGPDVYNVQTRLKALGYSVGALDGKFGKQTRAAVVAFQQLNGLAADGKVGAKTLTKLNAADAVAYYKPTTYKSLRRGATGADVSKLQTALKTAGYYTGDITGFYSYATEVAVLNFQKTFGLKADGIAGQQTLSVLYGTK